jgi:hypothetical protein
MTTTLADLMLDTTRFQEQVEEVARLLAERFPEGLPNGVEGQFLGRIDHLLSEPANVVFGKGVTTPLADGTQKIVYTVSLNLDFEPLFAAARAGNFDAPHGASLNG